MRKNLSVIVCVCISYFFISCNNTASNEHEITLSKKLLSTKLLNSERIKQKFGNYGIEVLSQTNVTRVSNLYSSNKGAKVTRTFAVVTYSEKIDSSHSKIHSQIINGASIGRVFKKNGWNIIKKPLYKGAIESRSEDFYHVYDLMSIQKKSLAFYMYNFHIQKDSVEHNYATITEVYHPLYINTKTLNLIYKDQQVPVKKTDTIDSILEIVYEKMQSN